ncbi:MAG: hypothetical protein AAGD00_05970 [Planctomycetota bacterium]
MPRVRTIAGLLTCALIGSGTAIVAAQPSEQPAPVKPTPLEVVASLAADEHEGTTEEALRAIAQVLLDDREARASISRRIARLEDPGVTDRAGDRVRERSLDDLARRVQRLERELDDDGGAESLVRTLERSVSSLERDVSRLEREIRRIKR